MKVGAKWILVSFLLSQIGDECLSVPVANFQLSGVFVPEDVTYGMIFDEGITIYPNDLYDMSLCFRFRLSFLRGPKSVVFWYHHKQVSGNVLTVELVHEDETIYLLTCRNELLNGECTKVLLSNRQIFNTWIHSCTNFIVEAENSTSTVATYINGILEKKEQVGYPSNVFDPLEAGGVMAIGQDLNLPGENFAGIFRFSGQISQVGIYDRILTKDEVADMSDCNTYLVQDGLVYGLETTQNWSIEGVDVTDQDISQLCEDSPIVGMLIMTQGSGNFEVDFACDKLEGHLPVPRNLSDLQNIHDKIKKAVDYLKLDQCKMYDGTVRFHLGQKFDRKTKTWVDPYNSTSGALNISALTGKNADEYSRGGCLMYNGARIESIDCTDTLACGFCELKTPQNLKLKGMCQLNNDNEDYDIEYHVYGQYNGRPHFRGYTNSHIFFDLNYKSWRLQSLRDPSKFLLMRQKLDEAMPIGRNDWEAGEEEAACEMEKGTDITLTLSVCNPDKFTCTSGDCIPLSDRCNNELDCLDKSDEQSCNYLVLGSNYASELLPRDNFNLKSHIGKDITRNKNRDTATIVYMNVSILAFPNIDTVNLKFTADFFLHMRWYDLRIDFRDLNNVSSLNFLSTQDMNNIWSPKLAFKNALGPFQTEVDKLNTGVIIREDIDPLPEDYSLSTEAMLFSGRTNSIRLTREYYQDYSCTFKLQYYPFDTQMCKMIFSVQGLTDNFLRLQQDGDTGIEFLGGRILVEYEIQMEAFQVVSSDGISIAEVQIVFRRRMEFHVTNTFLQTLFLTLIGYITLYFDVDNFTDRIMVTLTTLLVVATIMSSIQTSLPKTYYYKLIDWWLLFTLNTLILTMIFHTYLAYKCFKAKLILEEQGENRVSFRLARLLTPRARKRFLDEKLPTGIHEETGGLPETLDGTKTPHSKDHSWVASMDENFDVLEGPKRINRYAKVVYIILMLAFNIIFWTIALDEYLTPAEAYLTKATGKIDNGTSRDTFL